MLLFVGLGNPTPDSENNRHNVGFKIIDTINKKFNDPKIPVNIDDGEFEKFLKRKPACFFLTYLFVR